MVALIVITSIVVYIFVAIVLYHVTYAKLCERAGCNDSWSGYCEHDMISLVLAMLWPASYIVAGFGIAMYKAATGVAEKFVK